MASPRRRRLYWLSPLIILGAGLGFLRTDTAARLEREGLEQLIERQTGEDATIGQVFIEYWPPSAGLRGVVLSHPETQETLVAVREIRVSLGRNGWMPSLKTVEIQDPMVSLHVDADGLREFRGLKKAAGGGGDASTHVPWEALIINSGRFRLQTDQAQVDVSGIFVSPDGPDRSDIVVLNSSVTVGSVKQQLLPFVLEDVIITTQRLVLPNIRLATNAVQADGELAILFGSQVHGGLSLYGNIDQLLADLGKPKAFSGSVAVDLSLDGPLDAPGVGGVFIARDLGQFKNPDFPITLGDVSGAFEVLLPTASQAGKVQVYDLSWPFGEGQVEGEATLALDTQALGVNLRGEGLDLGSILVAVGAAHAPWVSFTGDLDASLQGQLSPFSLSGPFEIDLIKLRVADGPVKGRSHTILDVPRVYLGGDVSVDLQNLVFDADEIVTRNSRGSFVADIGIAGNKNLNIDINFPTFDLSVLQPMGDAGLGGRAELKGHLNGVYGKLSAQAELKVDQAKVLGFDMADHLEAHLDSPDLARLNFSHIQAQRRQTQYTGTVGLDFKAPEMQLAIDLDFPQGHLADVTSIFADLGNMDAAFKGQLHLKGGSYSLDGASTLSFSDINLYGEHFDQGQAVAWMDQGRFTLEELILERPTPEGTDSLLAFGSIGEGWKVNMGLVWDGAELAHLDHLSNINLPLQGRLGLDAHIGGTLFEPEPEGRIALWETHWAKQPLKDSILAFHTKEGALSWNGALLGNALHTEGTLDLWEDQNYALTAQLDNFPLDTFYPRAADGQDIRARTSGVVSLSGLLGDHPSPVEITADLPKVELAWDSHVLVAPEPWQFSVHGESIDIPGVSLKEGDKTDISFSGSTAPNGEMHFSSGQKQKSVIDLDLLRAVVPGMEEVEGSADLNLTIDRDHRGIPADIQFSADLNDAYIKTEYFPLAMEALNAHLEATPDQWVITDLQTTMGGGSLSSERSIIYADDWWPTRYALTGAARGVQIQYFDYLPPMLADADLSFDGPLDALLLSGAIQIQDMQFRERVDWEATVLSLQENYLSETAPEASESLFGMDLHVMANNTVHVRNNVANADASADLRLIGDTARPGMVGDIVVAPGGEVSLQDREFEVQRGEMRYVDPWSYDPELDVELHTEITSQDEDYRIRYLINGPFSNWSTSASSDPQLSQADINALLLFGVTREEMERGGYGNLGAALAVETGGLLSASLSSARGPTLIDRFINRWTLVSGVTERGAKTVSNEPRLVAESSQIGGFTFTGEYAFFGGDWYLSVERRIASRLYVAAYATTDEVGRTVPFAAVGGEFKLRWEMD